MTAHGRLEDDGLFERLYPAIREEGLAAGHGSELFERRAAGLELTESDSGSHLGEWRERGFAVRLFRAGRTAFAASGPEGALHLLENARTLLPRARTRRGARAPGVLSGEATDRLLDVEPQAPELVAVRELLTSFRHAISRSGGGTVTLREVSVSLGERTERIATSGGRDASWRSAAATLVATVVGRAQEARFSARVLATAARPEEIPVARLARHAADRVLLPLTGKAAPVGRLAVLLDSHVAAHLVARLAPLFFGDQDESVLQARTREGRDALTSPVLSLIDDAAAPGGPVRAPRDGEGTPKRRVTLVERGLLVGRLTDVAAAARLDLSPSGNAVRRSFAEPPQIGVTNFFVDPSPGVSPLDLLADVKVGLYAAVLLERPDVDLAADRFRLAVAGYAVEKGRASERIAEATVSGRLSELLRAVQGIGDDLKFVAGPGGGVGSPTLLIPRWKL